MRYIITLFLLIFFCLNAVAQQGMSQEEMDKRMNPGKEIEKLSTEMRKSCWGCGAPQAEFDSDDTYRVDYTIDKSEYKETKKNIREFAKSYVAEAYRRGSIYLLIVIKTGGLFGSHSFKFDVNDLISEMEKNKKNTK